MLPARVLYWVNTCLICWFGMEICMLCQLFLQVNNAGILTANSTPDSDIPDTLMDMFNVHVQSVYLFTQMSLEHLKKNKGDV